MQARLTRVQVHFSGSVQGVGFRFATRELAQNHQVTGWVRNLLDGRVQLVAEGERVRLERFLKALHAKMAAHIQDQQIEWLTLRREFSDFEIRT